MDTSELSTPELKFLDSLHQHKRYVFEAGLRIGGIPTELLFNHDASKFWPEEFPFYARRFHGDKGDPDTLTGRAKGPLWAGGFAYAWLHHIHHNPHHWQHWMFPQSQPPKDSSPANMSPSARRILPMPEVYVREMVADWMGANRTYQGTWDITEWLEKKLPQIEPNLHPQTIAHLSRVLHQLGYGIVHQMGWPVD